MLGVLSANDMQMRRGVCYQGSVLPISICARVLGLVGYRNTTDRAISIFSSVLRNHMEQCDLCNGLRGHRCIKDAMCREFKREYDNAKRETERLTTLFREACWYNFETACRTWKKPWYESWGVSCVEFHGVSYEQLGKAEKCTFPIWYSGPIQKAPPLPPEIIYNEIKRARAYERFMKKQITAPHDYAPGGREYEKLLREGEGVREYERLSSKHRVGVNAAT